VNQFPGSATKSWRKVNVHAVIAFEQDRLAARFSQRVCETIA
jgi:hypothetical protein